MARHHVCPACGYAYEPEKGESRAGVAPGTAFAQACSSFRCPVCNCPGQRFTEVEAVAAAVTDPAGLTGATGGGRYICLKCGHAYDPAKGDPDRGVAAGTAFVDLPEDWRCPTCKVPRDRFSPEA